MAKTAKREKAVQQRSARAHYWWRLQPDGKIDLSVEPRPQGSRKLTANDPFTPWRQHGSHLEGKDAKNGIHFYGTLTAARRALRKARQGKSRLPVVG